MLGVKNYEVNYINSKNDLIEIHNEELKKLKGKKLTKVYSVYELDINELWGDCPIILVFEDIQLELCFWKDRDISITFNKIDMSINLDWYGCESIELEWRENTTIDIDKYSTSNLTEIEIFENLSESFTLEGERIRSEKVLGGIGFIFGEEYLSVFNNIDEYGVSLSRELINYNSTTI